jgi:protein-disulfide isomerase
MTSQKKIVLGLLALVVSFFALGMYVYQQRVQNSQMDKVNQAADRLVRAASPVLGPVDARVTVVEFFDPACETCRAFYPFVKDLMRKHPQDIRLVLRYAPFHQGSDQVIKLLEAARLQGLYQPVLEMVLATQPLWADHSQPNVERAFQAAADAGLDLQKARVDMKSPAIEALLAQDVQDLTALEVTKTPTFFVNGRGLPSFGPQQLEALVAEELAKPAPQTR